MRTDTENRLLALSDFASIVSIPIAILLIVAAAFMGGALTTKKNRQEAVRFLKPKDLGATTLLSAAEMWSICFTYFFGSRTFSKRQILTIPAYTVSVSLIFFFVWIVYLYLFQNPTGDLSGELPPNFKQGLSDYFAKGIFAAVAIDCVTIQLTKLCVRTGSNYGYGSLKFVLLFILTLFAGHFIFSIAVFVFRVDDMVRLYMSVAPNDPLPVIRFTPIENIKDSLSFFQPKTLIHITSNGWYTTYFMPEPVLFYCAIASQSTLFFMALIMFSVGWINSVKNLAIGMLNNIGTPKAGGYSMLAIVWLFIISVITVIALLASLAT